MPSLNYYFNDASNNIIGFFDSKGEAICAWLLYELGLVVSFDEGVNLHVWTNGSNKFNVDFLIEYYNESREINGVLLEFHPSRKDPIDNRKEVEMKLKHVKLERFNGYSFYMFKSVEDLYEIIFPRFYSKILPYFIKTKDNSPEFCFLVDLVKEKYKRIGKNDFWHLIKKAEDNVRYITDPGDWSQAKTNFLKFMMKNDNQISISQLCTDVEEVFYSHQKTIDPIFIIRKIREFQKYNTYRWYKI